MYKGLTTRAYTPFGFSTSGASLLAFNGEFQEALSGFYPLGNGHRIYRPTLMRFCSPDNLSPFDKGGMNSYAYCGGDPVNYYDASGSNRVSAIVSISAMGRAIKILKKLTGAGAIAYAYDKRELITEFKQTIKHTVVPGEFTMRDASPARQLIDQNTAKSNRIFNEGLIISNRTLASNGNGSVGFRQAQTYAADSAQDWSDTYKFARSTFRWTVKAIKYRRPDAAAGAVLNGSSALLAASHDYRMYKTGGLFREAYDIRQ